MTMPAPAPDAVVFSATAERKWGRWIIKLFPQEWVRDDIFLEVEQTGGLLVSKEGNHLELTQKLPMFGE